MPRSPAARQLRRRLIVAGALVAALGALLVATCTQRPGDEPVVVFADDALGSVMRTLEREFEAAYPGTDLVVRTGTSESLAEAIEGGAAADVLFAASPAATGRLAERGLLRAPARIVVSNRLVVAGPEDVLLLAVPSDVLGLSRIALDDTARSARGRYARDAFRRAGLWEVLAPRVTVVPDTASVLDLVRHGEADAAIVFASDVRRAPGVRVLLEWPAHAHPPIRFTIAVPRTTQQPNRAFEFVEFVRQPARDALWRRFGFVPLAEPVL